MKTVLCEFRRCVCPNSSRVFNSRDCFCFRRFWYVPRYRESVTQSVNFARFGWVVLKCQLLGAKFRRTFRSCVLRNQSTRRLIPPLDLFQQLVARANTLDTELKAFHYAVYEPFLQKPLLFHRVFLIFVRIKCLFYRNTL